MNIDRHRNSNDQTRQSRDLASGQALGFELQGERSVSGNGQEEAVLCESRKLGTGIAGLKLSIEGPSLASTANDCQASTQVFGWQHQNNHAARFKTSVSVGTMGREGRQRFGCKDVTKTWCKQIFQAGVLSQGSEPRRQEKRRITPSVQSTQWSGNLKNSIFLHIALQSVVEQPQSISLKEIDVHSANFRDDTLSSGMGWADRMSPVTTLDNLDAKEGRLGGAIGVAGVTDGSTMPHGWGVPRHKRVEGFFYQA